MEIEDDVEADCICPKCGNEFSQIVHVTIYYEPETRDEDGTRKKLTEAEKIIKLGKAWETAVEVPHVSSQQIIKQLADAMWKKHESFRGKDTTIEEFYTIARDDLDSMKKMSPEKYVWTPEAEKALIDEAYIEFEKMKRSYNKSMNSGD